MIEKEKLKNYYAALSQKYNAVCFDIDGTLTEPDSNVVSKKAIDLISTLLNNKIPVVFITGRGETGLENLIRDLYPYLSVSDSLKTRMYALTNDGARLFYTDLEKDNKIFNSNKYIIPDNYFIDLYSFNIKVLENIKNSSISKYCDISYSKDKISDKLLNIRLVLNTSNQEIIKNINLIISQIIDESNFDKLNVTTGMFKGKTVIQIGTCKKDKAIEIVENIVGIPQNSMLRIGDCGNETGNDYSMLNCSQGFSVDKYSKDEKSCFPVVSDNGEILKGVDATVYLVNKVKLLPTLCLESASKQLYKKEYSKVERNINLGKNECIKKYSSIINEKFGTVNGIYDLYDKESGSILIPMYEWEMIDDNNPLKKLYSSLKNENLEYSLRDNNAYLLRGSSNYYYLLANRKSINDNDFTSYDNISQWYQNNIKFFERAAISITNIDEVNNSNDKLVLGILDNTRNFLIVLLNSMISTDYKDSNVLINLENTKNSEYNYIYKLLINNTNFMINLSTNKVLDYTFISKHLTEVINYGNLNLNSFLNFDKNEDYSKIYRTYREIDNFMENYITVALHNEKVIDDECVAGMLYGGLELPIIYKCINNNIKDVCLLKFNKNVSGYKKKQMIDIRLFDINEYGGLMIDGELQSNKIVLMDDNLMTGKTMQIALNAMCDSNLYVKNINVVRYPGINRVDQMFLEGHGAIDYRLFFEYITGLCFECPYSWRDENTLDKYKDSLGVFDLNKKKIIETLIKNHDYSTDSEVFDYYQTKRRVKK